MRPGVRRALDALVVVLVGGSAIAGAFELPKEFGLPRTVWQQLVPWCELAYVVGGVVVLLGWRQGARWIIPASIVWVLGCAGAATIASRAYGGAPWSAVLASGAIILLLGAGVVSRVRERCRSGGTRDNAARAVAGDT